MTIPNLIIDNIINNDNLETDIRQDALCRLSKKVLLC